MQSIHNLANPVNPHDTNARGGTRKKL